MTKMMVYMALARPIVAFDLPEHRFTAREAAVYVTPNDELLFACALAELMDDAERRDAMGSFGRQRVESALAWTYSIPALLEVYRTVTAAPAVAGASSMASRPSRGSELPEVAGK
jgi:glycosyltransferase involved in cell wall biosynthesis